jgi:hypothetical protein
MSIDQQFFSLCTCSNASKSFVFEMSAFFVNVFLRGLDYNIPIFYLHSNQTVFPRFFHDDYPGLNSSKVHGSAKKLGGAKRKRFNGRP